MVNMYKQLEFSFCYWFEAKKLWSHIVNPEAVQQLMDSWKEQANYEILIQQKIIDKNRE